MQTKTYIAGGSKGLGAAMVKVFSGEGHDVSEFSRSGTGVHHISCDFNDLVAIKRTLHKTFQTQHQQQNINLIINTATLAPFGPLAKAEASSVEQHLQINIESTLALLHAFVVAFQEHPANKTIAYISSGAARRPIPGLAMYSASKAFFERLIDTLAEEQKSQTHGIKCMIINPGVMNTGMQTEIRAQSTEDFPMVDLWSDLHKQGKLAAPADIAKICHQLITTTGKNGGYYSAQEYLAK